MSVDKMKSLRSGVELGLADIAAMEFTGGWERFYPTDWPFDDAVACRVKHEVVARYYRRRDARLAAERSKERS